MDFSLAMRKLGKSCPDTKALIDTRPATHPIKAAITAYSDTTKSHTLTQSSIQQIFPKPCASCESRALTQRLLTQGNTRHALESCLLVALLEGWCGPAATLDFLQPALHS